MSFSYAHKGSHRTVTLEVDAETYRRIEREAEALKLSLRAYVKARVIGEKPLRAPTILSPAGGALTHAAMTEAVRAVKTGPNT